MATIERMLVVKASISKVQEAIVARGLDGFEITFLSLNVSGSLSVDCGCTRYVLTVAGRLLASGLGCVDTRGSSEPSSLSRMP